MINQKLGINGQFKIDLYTKDNQLKFTTDYFDNFITNTGLSYPFKYGFADCFRYVSVGTGTGANTINGAGTTGLQSGINTSGYCYVGGGGGNQFSCNGLETGYYAKGCGYRIENSGVVLTRAWRIPQGNDNFFTKNITVKEYMISPGRPYVTGWYREDPLGVPTFYPTGRICGCSETNYLYAESGYSSDHIYGKELQEVVDFYGGGVGTNICSADKAFARVLKNVDVAINEYLVINYSLTVNYNTGIKYFEVAGNRSEPVGDVNNWPTSPPNISGIYSLVHPGIRLVNDGVVKSVSFVNDPLTVGGASANLKVGESFTPPLGDPMEPYISNDYIEGYVSNDGLQFLVNDISGGAMPTDSYFPYNANGRAFPSGVMAFNKNWISQVSTTTSTLGDKLSQMYYYNIGHYNRPRSSRNEGAYNLYPDETDFSIAAQYNQIFDNNFLPFDKSPYTTSKAESSYTASDRVREIKWSFQYKDAGLTVPEGIDGAETDKLPVRASVLTYKYTYGGTTYYFPYLDMCFAPVSGYPYKNPQYISGGGPMTRILTGSKTYSQPLLRVNTDATRLSGYYFLDDENILTLQFKSTWSSPCPSDVVGCP